MKTPQALTHDDWKKLMELPQVIDTWELDETHTVEFLSEMLYGAKFIETDAAGKIVHTLFVLTEGTSYGFSLLIHHYKKDDRFFVEN